ncbi:metallophosphoesterase [Actinopolymorpha sp. B11F2]|uniref:metallophosphoesterase n=1 Tax=Actinopolymorpha sp. B11F2 TaxID=3160862 RepID=UPI0032E41586
MTPADAAPPGKPDPSPTSPPVLTPDDGAYLEGTQTVAAVPTVADDDVTGLTIDGNALDADQTVGVSRLSFDVGSNSTEARYHNYVLVNGEHRIDIPDLVNERASLDIPNEHLVQGENTIEVITGTITTSCGVNHDDFVLSNFGLELLGEVADGEENEYSYAFGDGNCGSNSSLRLDAELTFFVLGDPQRTTGLSAVLDTTAIANGEHEIVARAASGASVSHTVTVNNAPSGAPRLTPTDGTIARGTQPVFASLPAAGGGTVESLTVDGADVPSRPTLGSGDATFSFTVGSNSIEERYHSFLLVNGMKFDIGGDYVSERVDVPVPNEWLVPGDNTIRFVTGTFPTSCGNNRDDYTISNVVLTAAHGTAAGQGLQTSYSIGDGNCGSSTTALREVDLGFSVDAPARGLRADLDTSRLADGPHTLSATSGTGQTATRTMFTDNTAPTISASTPAASATIRSSVPLDVQLDDASGVMSGPDVKLDGTRIELGALVGPGLSAGEHTLAVTGTDSLGNTATREIVFQSAGIPDDPTGLSPASGATDVQTTTTLEARVGEPDGGPVTATFSQTEILTPAQGWQGTTSSIPTTQRVPGEQNIGDTKVLAPGDSGVLESLAGRDVTYQRFDVQVEGSIESPVLRWEGVIDPARVVSLRAWNLQTQRWDALASRRGAVEDSTVLTAKVGPHYIDEQQVHVLVTGEDPFADDIDPGSKDHFDDPAAYDFSIVHFTDTQYLSEGAVEQETAEERAVWESAYAGIVDWIIENDEQRKIAYVAHTGDIVENNIRKPATPELEEQVVGEFEVSSTQQRVLDDAGVANGVIAGNHDNQSGTENGPGAIYNQYYGPDRYAAASGRWSDAEYGGPWREGDNQNHYDLFSAGGLDFVVVGLSYGVTRDEGEWADSIFKRFPDRNGILLSHDYLAPSSKPDGRGATFSAPDGSMLYNTVVQDNPNVFLILAGHEHGVGTNVKPEVGEVGNGVVELLADYQFYTVSADRLGLTEVGGYEPNAQLQFGASFLRMLQFDVDRGEMSVDTYSPLLDDFGATEYDGNHRYNGLEDNMVLPVDLTSRTTSFSTDSVALYAPVRVIGETQVPSGEVASVTWQGLKPGTAYAWIVTAQSTGGGTTSSQPSAFATRER